MFSLLYNFSLVLLAILTAPKLLWQWFVHGKYRESLKARLGISRPDFTPKKEQKVIWIHAVSMGEMRAIIPLFRKIREAHPESAILISATTETGYAEAKRSMPEADAHFFLPLDFSWIIRRLFHQIQPTQLILCESDFWYHLLKIAKERGVRIHLVNGKVSERSSRRFQKFQFFARQLFVNFDGLCIQSARFRDRFIAMGIPPEKLFITGNLKFDAPAKKTTMIECQELKDSLNIAKNDRVLVIGSTHSPEEELILSALSFVWKKLPELKVLIVPRHPERFNEVAHLIQEKGLGFRRLSERKKGNERLILIDAMGKLNQCYQIADIALVGGSYTSNIGGHNIFEPVAFGIPVLFGPHMHSQPDLAETILAFGAGRQVKIQQLPEALLEILQDSDLRRQYSEACHQLTESVRGATERTFAHLFSC